MESIIEELKKTARDLDYGDVTRNEVVSRLEQIAVEVEEELAELRSDN